MTRWQRVISWWDGRERREQWMLAAMGACLLAFLYWYGMLVPLRKLRDDALAGHRQAATALALVEARLQAMQAMQPQSARPSKADLPALLATSASRAGIDLPGLAPQADGSVVIGIDAVPATKVLAWLETLRREHALAPEQVSMDPAQGGVAAQLVFRADP